VLFAAKSPKVTSDHQFNEGLGQNSREREKEKMKVFSE